VAVRRCARWQGALWSRRKNGTLFAIHMTVDAVKDPRGEPTNYLALFSDVTRARERREEIEQLAYRDPLTRLPNRRLLSDRIDRALTLAQRHGKLVAICYLDIDDLKPINDTHGHRIGDQVLLEVARRLERAVRSHDTVARIGGDEFALLLTELATADEAERVTASAREALSEPFLLGSQCIENVSASMGLAIFPTDATDPDTLLRRADQRMYEAKRAGKTRLGR
jgi:diguanylate cyclase (GGDEF)-like protein